ncbi:MAG: hypothetical protein PHD40_03105 [Syntrophomonadaceae bacterium]|nr:hypothetical protein [Syntrophomonadaceae bacterium]
MPNIGGIRIPIVIIALLITVGLLLGGMRLYNYYNVEQAVQKSVTQIESVTGANVSKSNGQYTILIKLNWSQNLQGVYNEADQIGKQYFGNTTYSIQVLDKRNQRLNNIFINLQPLIYETLAKDEYVRMKSEIDKQVIKTQMDYFLQVDQDNIYISIRDGDYYLYEIIQRHYQEDKQVNSAKQK